MTWYFDRLFFAIVTLFQQVCVSDFIINPSANSYLLSFTITNTKPSQPRQLINMQSHLNKLNPNEIEFLRPLDQLMKVYCQSDKAYFCQLVERKKQLIQNLMSMGVDPDKYFALVTKVFKGESVQKEFARTDLVLLKHKHQMNKQTWFEQLVTQTQTALTQQQAKYNEYQSYFQRQHQKPQQPQQVPQDQNQPSNPLNINITQMTNLKLLDQYMGKYYQTAYKQIFIELYEKKQRILEALQGSKLSNENYLMIAKKIFNETKNDEVKKIVKNDLEMLEDLHDNRVGEWVKEAIKEAKDELPQQKETYQMHKKGHDVKKREKKTEIDLDAMMTIPIPPGTDPSQCISLSLIDRYMKQTKSNPPFYMTLYQKKQKLLAQHDDGKLNEKTYQEMLKRMIASITNEDLKEIYQSELNDIQDVHEGNTKQWFENVVEEARLSLMIQEDVYAQMKKEFKAVEVKKVEQKLEQPKKVQKKPQPQKQQPKITKKQSSKLANIDPILGYNLDHMFSLKVLQTSIMTHQQNPQLFLKLFAQKKKIIQMMMNKQLDGQKYKTMQQKLMASLGHKQFFYQFLKSDQVKDEIEFDLKGIEEFHDGDVEVWFMDVVESAGMSYDGQLARYEKELENKGQGKKIQQMNERIKENDEQQQQLQQEDQKPKIPVKKQQQVKPSKQPPKQQQIATPFNIEKMFSLKVIDNALTQHQSNQLLYMKIFSQKQKILKKMQNHQLDSKKYKALQQKMMQVFKENEDIKDMVEFDLAEIDDLHDGDVDKWFEEVVNSAGVGFENQLERFIKLQDKYGAITNKEQAKNTSTYTTSTTSIHSNLHYQSPQKQLQSKLSQASHQINHSTPKSKIRFYLHEMAVWQSLAKYYQKHHLNHTANKLLKIYFNVPRHEIQDIIEKIKTQPQYDIVSYCKKFFPPITEAVFYQGSENFEQRIEHGVKVCNKAIEQLKDYAKNLRKNLNVKNFEKVKEKITEYQENIKYLSSLPNMVKKSNKLIPLPLIEDTPVNYPNMDEHTHLQANEIELKLIKIENLPEEQLIKIYFDGTCRHESKVKNGPSTIVIKGKQTADNFAKVLRGDHRSFSISLYSQGWFSKTKQGKETIQMQFIRTNIHQGKVTIGKATIFYEARVRMAKTPLMTEIKEIKLSKFPPYEHSKQVQDDLLAKYTTASKA